MYLSVLFRSTVVVFSSVLSYPLYQKLKWLGNWLNNGFESIQHSAPSNVLFWYGLGQLHNPALLQFEDSEQEWT